MLYSFPHVLGAPGIGTTAANQVRGLVNRGLEVTVCTASVAGSHDGLGGDVIETLSVAGRRIPHRALGGDRALRYHDWRASRLLSEGFEVVHGWPIASVRTFEAARSAGVAGLRESPNTYTRVAYRRVAEEVARLGLELPAGASHQHNSERLAREEREYDLCSFVLAPSHAVAESYMERESGPPPILRHRYGFDPKRFELPAQERSDGPFRLLFVGSCDPRKGVHYALEAWKASGLGERGATFVIAGRWESAYRKLLAPMLSLPGVELCEFTDDPGALMRSADAFVLPSIEEGSALVTYEAQACGCVLLVSDAAGALMADGTQGFVHAVGDTDTLTAQLSELAGDPVGLAGMRHAVIAHRDQLTWAAAAARLEDVYLEAIGRGPG